MFRFDIVNKAVQDNNLSSSGFRMLYLIVNYCSFKDSDSVEIYNSFFEKKLDLSKRQVLTLTNELVDNKYISKEVSGNKKNKKANKYTLLQVEDSTLNKDLFNDNEILINSSSLTSTNVEGNNKKDLDDTSIKESSSKKENKIDLDKNLNKLNSIKINLSKTSILNSDPSTDDSPLHSSTLIFSKEKKEKVRPLAPPAVEDKDYFENMRKKIIALVNDYKITPNDNNGKKEQKKLIIYTLINIVINWYDKPYKNGTYQITEEQRELMVKYKKRFDVICKNEET